MTKEQKSEYNKRYWAKHKDEILAKRHKKAKRAKINARRRERYATDPEFRAKQAAATKRYLAKPEKRAKNNARMREYMRTYSKTDKCRARLQEYNNRPDVKARRNAYSKGYAAGMRRAKAAFMNLLLASGVIQQMAED